MTTVSGEILTIGDEILFGQTLDTNSHFISSKLSEIGVRVIRKTTIGDTESEIMGAFAEAERRADVVVITGGLGPTSDDLTKPCLARYFNVPLKMNEKALEEVRAYFEKRGRELTEANRQQAALPEGCVALSNPVGTAPGMWMERNGKVFISLPGVPHEMKYLIEHEVLGRIINRFPLPVIYHKMIKTCGIGESFLADKIRDWEQNLPSHFKLAYLPTLGEVKLRLTASGSDLNTLQNDANSLVEKLTPLAEDYIYGYDEDTLESKVGDILVAENLTIATAESCTGGYLAHSITSVPGSSHYYRGSVIAYHNDIKMSRLGIPSAVLEQYGAVSEETVRLMAENIRKEMNADIGVATSGIAGPDGGTPEKPVGLVWIAYSDGKTTEAKKVQFLKDRMFNIQYGAKAALTLLYRKLKKLD